MPLYQFNAEGFAQTDGVVRAKNKKEALELAEQEAKCELVLIDRIDIDRIPKDEEEDYVG